MRIFAQTVILLCFTAIGYPQRFVGSSNFSSFERAKKHTLHYDKPAVNFFEGALLGNGGMGVVVTTRPDGIMLYFGHNNVWDIRIAENHRRQIGDFKYVFGKVSNIPDSLKVLTDDPWYEEYNQMAQDNYSKPYPRPFPCGSVLLGFDRRKAELLGHVLDIAEGVCEVYLLDSARNRIKLQVFTDMIKDKLWMRLVDMEGHPVPNIFNRIRVFPDPSTPPEFPKYAGTELLARGILSFRQILPSKEPAQYDSSRVNAKDKAFRLTVSSNIAFKKTGRIDWNGNKEEMKQLEAAFEPGRESLVAAVSLEEGMAGDVSRSAPEDRATAADFQQSKRTSREIWQQYWSKSGVQLSDPLLEEVWYRNLYFFNCAAKSDAVPPGLFANWSYDKIGTAWHGDYHMNYNTQQPYWATFSSNHLEKNLPYVDLVGRLMDVSRRWAKEYYGLPGAYFPHSAYPVEMTMNPYPVPDWGWEICETPWTVQGLWWHYLYSADTVFLRQRAATPIREAVQFLVAYIQRPEAGNGNRWKDGNYHIFPTAPPELYSLRPGFQYNHDCIADLTLTKFLFKAFIQMTKALNTEKEDAALLSAVEDILLHFPSYPRAASSKYGEVFVAVPGEHDQVVYNVPLPLMPVFPGEDDGLHVNPATMQLLKNTYYNQQNEGGNDLVFINLQAARLGLLDLERFSRQVKYSLMPNGTAANMVMQTLGRFSDQDNYDYMTRMGVWFENFALPAVINECLMQSYDGMIRLFPNWDRSKDASFYQLRARGAFLLSAKLAQGKVQQIVVTSEKGGKLRLLSPWPKMAKVVETKKGIDIANGQIVVDMKAGETITLQP
ncbi:MAG: hypothetical protein J0H74_23585 [Chitinophagaceae bacterium]|nr:hypothetical protein [Chitinophagaceae bacterium]